MASALTWGFPWPGHEILSEVSKANVCKTGLPLLLLRGTQWAVLSCFSMCPSAWVLATQDDLLGAARVGLEARAAPCVGGRVRVAETTRLRVVFGPLSSGKLIIPCGV